MENLNIKIGGFAFVSSLLIFFSPLAVIIYVIIAVVIIDCFVAIIKAIATYEVDYSKRFKAWQKRKAINPDGLRRTALKLVLNVIFISLVYGAEIAIFSRSIYITNFTAFVIIFSELMSIASNLDLVMKTNRFRPLIIKIRKMFETKIMKQIGIDEIEEENKNNNEIK